MKHIPKLFTTFRERYIDRPGGYTRVLRIEPLNRNDDQAPSAILELVDGPRDMRFAMTAKTLARERSEGEGAIRDITARNIAKVTRFRKDGEADLQRAVRALERVNEMQANREPWEKWKREVDPETREEWEREEKEMPPKKRQRISGEENND